MNRFLTILILGIVGILFYTSCGKNNNEDLNNLDCSIVPSSYSRSVNTIVAKNCLTSGCHNSGSSNGDFTSYDGLKAKVDNGTLDTRVIQEKSMPPSGELSHEELKVIKCWLNSGAPNN